MEASEVPNRKASSQGEGVEKRDADDRVEQGAAVTNLDSLRRLRDRVQSAAQELQQLRRENAALHKRIAEFEAVARPGATPGESLLLDGDQEALRRKVEGFILAIDRILEEDSLSN